MELHDPGKQDARATATRTRYLARNGHTADDDDARYDHIFLYNTYMYIYAKECLGTTAKQARISCAKTYKRKLLVWGDSRRARDDDHCVRDNTARRIQQHVYVLWYDPGKHKECGKNTQSHKRAYTQTNTTIALSGCARWVTTRHFARACGWHNARAAICKTHWPHREQLRDR